jgi:DNA replication protein DnaC
MDDELRGKLKYLRFNSLLEDWDAILGHAEQENFSHRQLLCHIVETAYEHKKESARCYRFNQAKIPEPYRLETFPFERQPTLNRKKIHDLYDTFEYIRQHRNITWIGPTGAGKTGLATAFLSQAIDQGYKGRFITFPDLIVKLYHAVADHSGAKLIKRFATYDCLLIDELGYVEVEPVQVGLFFTLMQKRHRKKCTLVTSNLGFGQWTSFLKNEHLTAALIDRLTENSHVINMKKCTSLRPKLTKE